VLCIAVVVAFVVMVVVVRRQLRFNFLLLLLFYFWAAFGRKSTARKATQNFYPNLWAAPREKGQRLATESTVHARAAFIKITVLKYALSKLHFSLQQLLVHATQHATCNN